MIWKKRSETNSIRDAHLAAMGIRSTDEINDWYKKARAGRYRIDGIKKVCDVIRMFAGGYIYIFGDYDADGICATSILYRAFRWYGCRNVFYRLPHRFTEGYGMSKAMVDEIEHPNSLIITVDNGIATHEVIDYAKAKGYTVIVTDHHEPVVEDGKVVLPNADIVIDPKAIPGSADFDGYCGAGLAYRIAKELLKDDSRTNLLVPTAAIATVCDQMKIVEENYFLVRDGLAKLNMKPAVCVPGLNILGNVLGIGFWDSTAFGFSAGPAINAPERMKDGEANLCVRLLISDDVRECQSLALMLNRYNEERKKTVKEAAAKTAEAVDADNVPYPLIAYIPDISEGIIGIVAGKLAEKFGVPAGVFTGEPGSDILKGSFRTVPGYNIKKHLDMCGEYFTAYGGHADAAGASVKRDMFDKMRTAMISVSERPAETEADNVGYYDVDIENKDITSALLENEKFQPFGNGNRNLIFRISGFRVLPNFGEIKKHIAGNGIKLHSAYSDAIGFGLWDLGEKIDRTMDLTLYGEIAYNRFNGKVMRQITIFDIEIP